MKKLMLYLLTVLIILLVILLPLFLFVFSMGDMTKNTVVETIPSPDGAYIAQVIDSDQGAMGGNTMVEVYRVENPGKTQRIYTGPWGVYENMEIYWETDSVLVIDGTQYPIQ